MKRGPDEGYDTGPKRQYRRDVYADFARLHQGQTADKHLLLMPSLEGDEIDVALSKGYREDHLHCVDRNPAVVASLKKRYPRIITYGVELEDAVSRMVREVELDGANFDLMGTATEAWMLLHRVMIIPAWSQSIVFGATILRGREGKHDFQNLKEASESGEMERWGELSMLDTARLQAVWMALSVVGYPLKGELQALPGPVWAVHPERGSIYVSPNGIHRMLFTTGRMHTMRASRCRTCWELPLA